MRQVRRMMSALSHQVNMNNFLSLLVGASLVAANSSPSHHDPTAFSHPTEFSNGGVSSFALPTEDGRIGAYDSYTLAFLNYTYEDQNGKVNNEEELVAKYGEGRILNRTGLLVHVTKSNNAADNTGCAPDWNGTSGGPLPERNVQWIALIKRGGCNFEEKVKHAYTHGASGVIIYNDKDDPRLDKMKINDKERNITAVFTTKAKGHELIDLVERLKYQVNITIAEGGRHIKPLANINRTSVLFVSISFIVLMIISLVWLVFYYVQRFRYLQTKDKQSRRLCNVAKRIIAKIPTKSIKADDKEIDNDCCAICIEPYKVTDVIRVLPCKHEFHKVCIDPWLLEHRTCPMCKMDILKHYGFVVGSPHSSSVSSSSAQNNRNNNPTIVADYFSVAPPPPQASTHAQSTSTSHQSRSLSHASSSVSGGAAAGNTGSSSTTDPDQIVSIIINMDGSNSASNSNNGNSSVGSAAQPNESNAGNTCITDSRQITDV